MNKKDLQIELLESIVRVNTRLLKFYEDEKALIDSEYNDNKLLKFKDADINSNFKFEIVKLELVKNVPVYSVERAPSSRIDNNKSILRLSEKTITEEFAQWVRWLKIYDQSSLTLEEKILKQYENEFYSDFEIVDEDSNESSFSVEQQLFLDQYLNYVEDKLLQGSEKNAEIENIIEDVQELRKCIGKETKKKIIKGLSKIFAKLRQSSITLLREFYSVAKKELLKQLLLGGLDEISGLIQ
jgi:hypothetical protein